MIRLPLKAKVTFSVPLSSANDKTVSEILQNNRYLFRKTVKHGNWETYCITKNTISIELSPNFAYICISINGGTGVGFMEYAEAYDKMEKTIEALHESLPEIVFGTIPK